MSFAQFKDNVFDQDQAAPSQDQHSPSVIEPAEAEAAPMLVPNDQVSSESAIGVPGPGEQEEGPGNPGEPVPINGYIPLLLVSALALILYTQRRNKKVNI